MPHPAHHRPRISGYLDAFSTKISTTWSSCSCARRQNSQQWHVLTVLARRSPANNVMPSGFYCRFKDLQCATQISASACVAEELQHVQCVRSLHIAI